MDFAPELLRALVAVAEAGGFTRAAERLHLTQSAVSHQIRRLEDLVGTPLFIRTTRKLALTAQLLHLRQREVVPRLKGIGGHAGRVLFAGSAGLGVEWKLADGSRLALFANLSAGRMGKPVTFSHNEAVKVVLWIEITGLRQFK